jgi:hypothetical protein
VDDSIFEQLTTTTKAAGKSHKSGISSLLLNRYDYFTPRITEETRKQFEFDVPFETSTGLRAARFAREGKHLMKKTILKAVILSVFAVLLNVAMLPAFAGTLTITLNDENGSYINNNEYIGPYDFTLSNSKTNTNTPLKLICVSLGQLIGNGETWDVSVSTAGQLDTLNHTTNYLEAAYLDNVLVNNQGTDAGYLAQWSAWNLFDPTDSRFITQNGKVYVSGETGMGSITDEQSVALAAINTDPSAYSNYQFFLPTANQAGWTYGLPQTLVGNPPVSYVTPTSEPTSFLLLGSGLVFLSFMLFRKNSHNVA